MKFNLKTNFLQHTLTHTHISKQHIALQMISANYSKRLDKRILEF